MDRDIGVKHEIISCEAAEARAALDRETFHPQTNLSLPHKGGQPRCSPAYHAVLSRGTLPSTAAFLLLRESFAFRGAS